MYQLTRKVRRVLHRSTQNRELKLQCLMLKLKSLSVKDDVSNAAEDDIVPCDVMNTNTEQDEQRDH